MSKKLFAAILALALLFGGLAVGSPVLANHEWELDSVTCVGGTIFVEARHLFDTSAPGLWVDVYVNSAYLTTVEFFDDSAPQPVGSYTLTMAPSSCSSG